jgi:hypothetical protein
LNNPAATRTRQAKGGAPAKGRQTATPFAVSEEIQAAGLKMASSRHHQKDLARGATMGSANTPQQIMIHMQAAANEGRVDDAKILSEQLILALEDAAHSSDQSMLAQKSKLLLNEEEKFEHLFHNMHQLTSESWVHAGPEEVEAPVPVKARVLAAQAARAKFQLRPSVVPVKPIEFEDPVVEQEPTAYGHPIEWAPDLRETIHIPEGKRAIHTIKRGVMNLHGDILKLLRDRDTPTSHADSDCDSSDSDEPTMPLTKRIESTLASLWGD